MIHNKKKQERKSSPKTELTDEEVLQWDGKARPAEIISLDIDEEGEETPGLDEETTLDLLKDALAEKYAEQIAEYTDSWAVQEALEARQELNTGERELLEALRQHHAKSPQLSGGDIDAAWDEANVGEETVGGMAPTPDQDVVDEIGEAFGLSYEDDEPLHTGEKLAARDRHRWELDPASVEEEE
jgi:hypothetical protein